MNKIVALAFAATVLSACESTRSVSPAAPTPTPESSPPAAVGCTGSTAAAIVACERKQFGRMSRGELPVFLRAVATSLNANGIPGGPYGILRKTIGNHCDGYACDIICTGQSSRQRQWDVLTDADGAQKAGWGHPLSRIRVDACEIP